MASNDTSKDESRDQADHVSTDEETRAILATLPSYLDDHYATVKIDWPETNGGRKVYEQLVEKEPQLEPLEYPGHTQYTKFLHFECTQPSEYYNLIKLAGQKRFYRQRQLPNGTYMYIRSIYISSRLPLLRQFKRYCKHFGMRVLYRQNSDGYQFAFRMDDLYLVSRFFAKSVVYGRFGASENPFTNWRGRVLKDMILTSDNVVNRN